MLAESQNPYSPPESLAGSIRPARTWQRVLVALTGIVLPCALAWLFLEAPYLWPRPEPEGSIKTPNPQRAPWYFVSGTQTTMMLVNPRLAIFAARWTYVVYLSWIVWPVAGPLLFPTRPIASQHGRRLPRMGLFAASLLAGAFLAWPWLAAIFIPSWLGP
jgi:hypothetical protein